MQPKTYILAQANLDDAPAIPSVVCDVLKPIGALFFIYVILVGALLGTSLLRHYFK